MGLVRMCRRCASNAKTDTFRLSNTAAIHDATNFAMFLRNAQRAEA